MKFSDFAHLGTITVLFLVVVQSFVQRGETHWILSRAHNQPSIPPTSTYNIYPSAAESVGTKAKRREILYFLIQTLYELFFIGENQLVR